MIELLKIQKKLAENLVSQCNDSDPKIQVLKDNVAIVDSMIAEKMKLEEEVRRLFLDPLNKYKQQYREMDERIRERQRRCDEMDKLASEIKKYTEKKDPRLAGTERRHESVKRSYEDLNTELIAELPKIVADKGAFLEPLVAVLIDIQAKFYSGMGTKLQEVQVKVSHIDRNLVLTHPRVILPREQSAISRNYSQFVQTVSQPTSSVPPQNYGYNQTYTQPPPQSYGQPQQPYGQPTQPYGQPQPQYVQNQPQSYGTQTKLPPVPPNRGNLPQPPPKFPRATALWDFETTEPEELPFRTGDVLNIHSQQGGWWKAELNGRIGLIPSNYVKLV